MKRNLILAVLTFCSIIACGGRKAQTTDNSSAPANPKEKSGMLNKSYWYDGNCLFFAERKGDNIVFTGEVPQGDTYSFTLKPTDKKHFTLVSDGGTTFLRDTWGLTDAKGAKFELKIVTGVQGASGEEVADTVLIVRDKGGKLVNVLGKSHANLRKVYEEQVLMQMEGWFSFSGEGACAAISGSAILICGEDELKPFRLGTDDDIALNLLRTEDGKAFFYYIETHGVNLYEAYFSKENNRWEQGNISMELMRQVTDLDDGCWSFTATRPLNRALLSDYDRQARQLMKNEILARHGCRFDDPEMNHRFESYGWSQIYDRSEIHLTEIEQLNMEMLESMERN